MKHRTADSFRLWICTAFTCLTIFLGNSTAVAAEPEWKVGLAQVKITPEHPVQMSGYGGRTKPFEKVAADLYVKVLMLEDRDKRTSVIVTSDLLGFPAAVAEPIYDRIASRIGVKR